jgi:hypothetical protein
MAAHITPQFGQIQRHRLEVARIRQAAPEFDGTGNPQHSQCQHRRAPAKVVGNHRRQKAPAHAPQRITGDIQADGMAQ